jgi:hypothetical protein
MRDSEALRVSPGVPRGSPFSTRPMGVKLNEAVSM